MLADRLAAVTTLIHTNQTGFIPGRQIIDNIRLVTNIIQDANIHPRPVCLLSLDIHKAFDSVNWSYLNYLLPKFGISDKFIHGFNALYHFPEQELNFQVITQKCSLWVEALDRVALYIHCYSCW